MNTNEILETLQGQISSSLDAQSLPEGLDSNAVATSASESIFANLQAQVNSGNMTNITEMFSGSETASDHASISGLSPDIIDHLSSKFGIDSATSSSIVSQILPGIMNVFNNKVNSGNIDLQSIIGQFQNTNISDMISNVFDGNSGETPEQKGGGILNIIKGFFGK